MKGLVESVKENGVHQPALVCPRKGGGHEIIAGRRQRASELARFGNMPCIIRNITDDEAVNHQEAKLEGVTAGDVEKRSTKIVERAKWHEL